MNKIILTSAALILSLAVLSPASFADTPAPNMEYSVHSPNGQYSVRMVPQDGWGGYGPGEGVVYKMEGEAPQELWKVDFYSGEVLLADDGRHLIAFGPWASEMTDKALSFYDEGKELKTYLIQDLIDEGRVLRTSSHFLWKDPENAKASWFSEDGSLFTLKLIDASLITFDVKTGEIKSRS